MDNILHYSSVPGNGKDTDTDNHSITVNVPREQICQGRENGIECQRIATHQTPAFNSHDVWFLCDPCWRQLMRYWMKLHYIRRETRGVA